MRWTRIVAKTPAWRPPMPVLTYRAKRSIANSAVLVSRSATVSVLRFRILSILDENSGSSMALIMGYLDQSGQIDDNILSYCQPHSCVCESVFRMARIHPVYPVVRIHVDRQAFSQISFRESGPTKGTEDLFVMKPSMSRVKSSGSTIFEIASPSSSSSLTLTFEPSVIPNSVLSGFGTMILPFSSTTACAETIFPTSNPTSAAFAMRTYSDLSQTWAGPPGTAADWSSTTGVATVQPVVHNRDRKDTPGHPRKVAPRPVHPWIRREHDASASCFRPESVISSHRNRPALSRTCRGADWFK